VKCLLIVPFPESSLNEQAGRQFMENYQEFTTNAKVYTQVHARPNAQQQKMIEQHMAQHYKAQAKEEQKTYQNQQYECQNSGAGLQMEVCGGGVVP
jgi:ubiquitin-conjugating enzyme E2 S